MHLYVYIFSPSDFCRRKRDKISCVKPVTKPLVLYCFYKLVYLVMLKENGKQSKLKNGQLICSSQKQYCITSSQKRNSKIVICRNSVVVMGIHRIVRWRNSYKQAWVFKTKEWLEQTLKNKSSLRDKQLFSSYCKNSSYATIV